MQNCSIWSGMGPENTLTSFLQPLPHPSLLPTPPPCPAPVWISHPQLPPGRDPGYGTQLLLTLLAHLTQSGQAACEKCWTSPQSQQMSEGFWNIHLILEISSHHPCHLPEVRTGHCRVSHAAMTQGQSPTSVPRSCTERCYGTHQAILWRTFIQYLYLFHTNHSQTENQTQITYGSKVARRSLSPFSCRVYIHGAKKTFVHCGSAHLALMIIWSGLILLHVCVLSLFSHVWLFATLWIQAHLTMGFSRQEY